MRRIMVFIIVAMAFTGVQAKGKMDIEARKAKITTNIDKRIAVLNDFKTCVSSASEKATLKACRATKKQAMKAIKDR